jgi:hypothetical protein
MMIIMFILSCFFMGWTISLIFPLHSRWGHLAMAPLIGAWWFSIPLYGMNFFHVTWTPFLYKSLLFSLSFFIIIFQRQRIWEQGKQLCRPKNFDRKEKFFLFILLLGLFGMLLRLQHHPMWTGDAYLHWAPKAIHWIQRGGVSYSEEMGRIQHIWISYPLMHSLDMVALLFLLPDYPAYSIKIFDYFPQIGLFFSFAFFFSYFTSQRFLILFLALVGWCAQKQFMNYMISGYADPLIGYSYFLGILCYAMGLFSLKKPGEFQKAYFYAGGFIFGIMLMTKYEGLVRWAFFLGIFSLFLYRKRHELSRSHYLTLSYSLGVTLLLRLLDYLNRPVTYFVDNYLETMNFQISVLWHRFWIMFQASLLSFAPQGLFKSFWLLLWIGLGLLFIWARKSSSSKWAQWKEWNTFFILLFIPNWIFNHIPNWIADTNNDIHAMSSEMIVRLNIHLSSLLAASFLLGIIIALFPTSLKKHVP